MRKVLFQRVIYMIFFPPNKLVKSNNIQAILKTEGSHTGHVSPGLIWIFGSELSFWKGKCQSNCLLKDVCYLVRSIFMKRKTKDTHLHSATFVEHLQCGRHCGKRASFYCPLSNDTGPFFRTTVTASFMGGKPKPSARPHAQKDPTVSLMLCCCLPDMPEGAPQIT